MDSGDNKVLPQAFGSHASSSTISTPEKNGRTNYASKGLQHVHEFLTSYQKKKMIQSNSDKQRKHGRTSKCKSTEELLRATGTKGCMNLSLKKLSTNPSASTDNQGPPRKQPRKGEHPVRLPLSTELCQEFRCSSTWICKNSACKAVLTSEETFCKRCSCCICHLFDDNKDPSLWFVCTSESGGKDWCGLSCHIECAIQHRKAGVLNLGQFMQLDGSCCCASCGKVFGIIGCWKKQLAVAKDSRRIDTLCYRISLSYRLLHGTSRFKELHEIVEHCKAKLENEVGPVSGISAKTARGIASRLSVVTDVQKLCSLAIEKAEELTSKTNSTSHSGSGSLPGVRFLFEQITTSSLVIVLKYTFDAIKGYKLWYCKSSDSLPNKEPLIFPKSQERVLVSNLEPCTGYTFRIVPFTEDGDLGHSESNCFTESTEANGAEGSSSCDAVKLQTAELDLNVASVPDLNAEINPLECCPDGDLISGSSLQFSNGLGRLDDNYEYCVKVLRWLESSGLVEKDFRLKFLTWFSLRSSEPERRVVITFIRTLIEEPSSLAGQLIDSFSEIVMCKRAQNGFCSNV